jgi:hypothetical protein
LEHMFVESCDEELRKDATKLAAWFRSTVRE